MCQRSHFECQVNLRDIGKCDGQVHRTGRNHLHFKPEQPCPFLALHLELLHMISFEQRLKKYYGSH